jgi:transposase
MRLTDKQWEKIQYLVPDGPVRNDGKGRPWRNKQEVLEGIPWIVKTSARWRDLPTEHPPTTRPAIAGSSSGWKKVSLIRSLRH